MQQWQADECRGDVAVRAGGATAQHLTGHHLAAASVRDDDPRGVGGELATHWHGAGLGNWIVPAARGVKGRGNHQLHTLSSSL